MSKTFPPALIVQLFVFLIIVPFLPILITGNWGWLEGWLYALISIFGFIISRILAGRKHPDLLRERARMAQHDDAKSWDKVLSRLVGLGGAALPLVAGLDMRDGWSSGFIFSWSWKSVALLVMLLAYVFGT